VVGTQDQGQLTLGLNSYPRKEGELKSNASDPVELLWAVYLDACSLCPAEVSPDLRDLMTIRARVKAEGLSFLTITLPSFAKDFERSLADGYIASTMFAGFRKIGAIPAFLQGMLKRIFDQETGRLYDEIHEHPTLCQAVRQVCLLYKKVDSPCSPERDSAAIANFIQVEQLNKDFSVTETDSTAFAAVSEVLWASMLSSLSSDMLVPRHGPGATAERVSGNRKYVWRRWHDRLDRVFPLFDYAYSLSAFVDSDPCIEDVTIVPPEEEEPVRVVLVPKTLKSPRVIAIEPACMQYAQQAVQSILYDAIETHWLTRGHVNFRDQSINQGLALTSSRTGRFATIDLADASDRVLLSVVELMFQSSPWLWDLIVACRSDRAKVPDGRVIGPLRKFASMGSALCFPVEAMYFYTSCVVALLAARNLPVNPRNVYLVSRDVYVYGDDLIVPVDEAGTVIDHLQKYNCKVNNSKTFLSGKFRESCGVDAYDGHLVTPTYVRHWRPDDRRQSKQLISWIATANAFQQKGFFRAASLMFCTCESLLGPLPYISSDSPGLGRIAYYGERLTAERRNAKYQTSETKIWTPATVYCSDYVDGYPALQKCLLRLGGGEAPTEDISEFRVSTEKGFEAFLDYLGRISSADTRHLERTAQRGAVSLKRRWVLVQH